MDGGAPIRVVAARNGTPDGIAVDGTNVYWSERSGILANGIILRAAVDGGAPAAMATGQYQPGTMAVDATSVYWINSIRAIRIRAP